eukprot:scaffold7382_cov406-Prasinococcus_capsulatus_cf.AAC.24
MRVSEGRTVPAKGGLGTPPPAHPTPRVLVVAAITPRGLRPPPLLGEYVSPARVAPSFRAVPLQGAQGRLPGWESQRWKEGGGRGAWPGHAPLRPVPGGPIAGVAWDCAPPRPDEGRGALLPLREPPKMGPQPDLRALPGVAQPPRPLPPVASPDLRPPARPIGGWSWAGGAPDRLTG